MIKFVALCGLHDAGKSAVASRLASQVPGCVVVTKLDVLRALHAKQATPGVNWYDWYRTKYLEEGPSIVMQQVIDQVLLDVPSGTNMLVIDAVHSAIEWRTLRERFPAALVLVASPPDVRLVRRHGYLALEDDVRRIRFAHDADMVDCLFASADWVVPGCLETLVLDYVLEAFLGWFRKMPSRMQPSGSNGRL